MPPIKNTVGVKCRKFSGNLAMASGIDLTGGRQVPDEVRYHLDDDHHPDRGQHAFDHGDGEKQTEFPSAKATQYDLHEAGETDGHEHERIAHRQVAVAEHQHTGQQRGARPAAGPLIVTKDPPRKG